MTDQREDDVTVVPLPGSSTQQEHDRIRQSNDRDQDAERHGHQSRHNRGYDETADGVKAPDVENPVDQD
jgi:hypothetical protein